MEPRSFRRGTKEREKDSRSILIYMCGSNLETNFGAATNNIDEMLSVKLPEGVHVILETGGAKSGGITRSPMKKFPATPCRVGN